MKYHSFYMRVLCLILIIGAVLGYNFMQKNDTQAQEITELTDRVGALEEQQQEMLTALGKSTGRSQGCSRCKRVLKGDSR